MTYYSYHMGYDKSALVYLLLYSIIENFDINITYYMHLGRYAIYSYSIVI